MLYSVAEGLRVAAAFAILFVLPWTVPARRAFRDLSWPEAAVVALALFSSAYTLVLILAWFGLHVTYSAPFFAGVWLAMALPGYGFAAKRALDAWRSDPLSSGLLERLPSARSAAVALGLAGVGAVAAWWAAWPHLHDGFLPPYHKDEWQYWAGTRAEMQHGGFVYPNYFTNRGAAHLQFVDKPAWMTLNAALAWLGGIPLHVVWAYGAMLLLALLALATYAYASRAERAFGWEAALLVPLMPTTIRYLGPAYYVPMPFVIVVALAAGILTRQANRRRSLPAIFLLGAMAPLFHGSTSGLVALVAGWGLLLRFRTRRDLGLAALSAALFSAVFFAIVLLVPSLHHLLDVLVSSLQHPAPPVNGYVRPLGAHFFQQLGWLVMLLFAAGAVTAFRGRRADQQVLVLSLVPVLAILVVKDVWALGFENLYARAFIMSFFLITAIAGAGLAEARRAITAALRWITRSLLPPLRSWAAARLRRGRRPILGPVLAASSRRRLPRALAVLVALAVVLPTVAATYAHVKPIRADEFRYRYINDANYEAAIWVRDHPDALHGANLTLADPFTSVALGAMTGLPQVFASYTPTSNAHQKALYDRIEGFLSHGCHDTSLLNDTHATVVFGATCDWRMPQYWLVHDHVYLYLPNMGIPDRYHVPWYDDTAS